MAAATQEENKQGKQQEGNPLILKTIEKKVFSVGLPLEDIEK